MLNLTDLRQGYIDLISYVTLVGDQVAPRGIPTLEVRGLTLLLNDATVPTLPIATGRGVNLSLAAVETLQLISGLSRPDLVKRATPNYDHVLVSKRIEDMNYAAYGPRLDGQIYSVINLLRDDPSSRQAVLAIWRSDDLTHDGDKPCTLNLQFFIRNDRLDAHVVMRSQDVWLGVPYDLFAFTQLQLTIASRLDVRPGRYVHHVGSMHIYERDLKRAQALQLHDIDDLALPRGVCLSERHQTVEWAAGLLLMGIAQESLLELNPWYARQLRRIGVPS